MRVIACCALASLVCAAAPAGAGPNARLQEARRLIDDLELEQALKVLDAADRAEGNDRETYLEILLLQGITFGTLGKDAKTRDSFRKLLVLAPEATLPRDLPPRVRTPFFEAKEWAASNGPLTLEGSSEREDGVVKRVSVTLGKDVLRLAKTARFHLTTDAGAQVVEVAVAGGGAQAPVGRARVTWFAEVLSERKAVLVATAPKTEGPPVLAPASVADATASAAPAPGAWRRPAGFAVLGGGVIAAGVGVVFGLQSAAARAKVTNATRDAAGRVVSLTQQEAATLESSAQRQALAANVLFGVGGGLAAAGVVLVVMGPSSAPVVTMAPAPGGVVLSGSF